MGQKEKVQKSFFKTTFDRKEPTAIETIGSADCGGAIGARETRCTCAGKARGRAGTGAPIL